MPAPRSRRAPATREISSIGRRRISGTERRAFSKKSAAHSRTTDLVEKPRTGSGTPPRRLMQEAVDHNGKEDVRRILREPRGRVGADDRAVHQTQALAGSLDDESGFVGDAGSAAAESIQLT